MGAVKTTRWIIIFGLLCGLRLSAQSIPISGQVLSQYGSPVAGAQVYICNAATSTGLPCTPTANIYQDYNLTTPVANPTITDANGDFNVYVGPVAFPNVYVVNAIANPGGTPYTWLYPGPSCPLSGCTFSGNVTAPIFNATMSPYYEINGVQISSSALSDAANIAFLNASNVFTGAVQTAPIWNATGSFEVNGVALASTNLSDSANLARLDASNVFTGETNTFAAIVGTTVNATTGYQFDGSAASNHVLLGNGTNYVDSATIPYSIISGAPAAPFSASSVIPFTTSTTTSTAATSANVVSVLNTSPTTIFAAALLPKATSSAFGAVEPDNSTITVSGGVISSVAIPTAVQTASLISSDGTSGSRQFYQTANPDTTPPASDIYQNTTGHLLIVTVTADGGGNGFHGIVYCDSSSTPTTKTAALARVNDGSSNPNYYPGSTTFVVPNGYYYGISVTNATGTPVGVNALDSWTEWEL